MWHSPMVLRGLGRVYYSSEEWPLVGGKCWQAPSEIHLSSIMVIMAIMHHHDPKTMDANNFFCRRHCTERF